MSSTNRTKFNPREKSARETERVILEYLKEQEKPISFYTLYKNLNFSSGRTQTALRRMEKKNMAFVRKRIKRFENLVWHKEFEVEPNIIDLEKGNLYIIPLRLNRTIGLILEEIPSLTPEFKDLTTIFKNAISSFFIEKIPFELRREAVYQAIKKKKISESLGRKILGSV